MTRSHPPTLLTLARRALDEARVTGTNASILVAVSGGPDSMALLHVLSRLAPRARLSVTAHGVDHGLRAAAGGELSLARELADALGVPFGVTRVDVGRGGNLQARAREARYAALREAGRACGADFIATAHHAGDRAETVLLRLLRGAGPAGLAVLPARSGNLLRPFIRASRPAILAHMARHAVPYATDPSNVDPQFLRVRVRQELLPLMEELSPGVANHLCALADALIPTISQPFSEGGAPAPLPRSVRLALEELERTRSRTMRVLLPGGLVATYDRTQATIIVGPASSRESTTEDTGAASAAVRRVARERERGRAR